MIFLPQLVIYWWLLLIILGHNQKTFLSWISNLFSRPCWLFYYKINVTKRGRNSRYDVLMLKVKMLVCQSRKINFSATDFCAIIWILNQLFAAGWMTYYGVHGDGVKTWWYRWWYRINYKNEKRVRKKEYVYLDLDYSNKVRDP